MAPLIDPESEPGASIEKIVIEMSVGAVNVEMGFGKDGGKE